ncbi:MAG: sigma-70 family RNA polymerase sigma factor [Flavobacteriales bacterium]|nr:sigma-70 family RNA polymerase sigma factor [Flavobacteriales bacterium]
MLFFKSKNISNYSDNELITDYKKNGDKQVVGELFGRYSHLVFGVCMKYLKDEEESKDAVLEIFEQLMDDLKRFQISNFKSWLHSVCRNHCLMKIREEQVQLKKINEYQYVTEYEGVVEYSFQKHEKQIQETQLTDLEKAMMELKDEQRICIELFFLKEKCYEDVAKITGYTMSQVKSHIQNGKRNLSIKLTSNK